MRVWLFARSFIGGTVVGTALVCHFTYKQVAAADWELQHALEDLSLMEAAAAQRGEQRLREIVADIRVAAPSPAAGRAARA